MAGAIQNWSSRNLDTKQTDYGNPHKEYAAIRYGNVKIHLHDKRSILKCLFLLPLYMHAYVYTRTHVHIGGHYAPSVSNRQVCSFLLCLLHVNSMAFSWAFSYLGTAWLPNHSCGSIFFSLFSRNPNSLLHLRKGLKNLLTPTFVFCWTPPTSTTLSHPKVSSSLQSPLQMSMASPSANTCSRETQPPFKGVTCQHG